MNHKKTSLLLASVAASALWAIAGCSSGGSAFSAPSNQSRNTIRTLIGHQELALAQGGAQVAPIGGGSGPGGTGVGGGIAARPGIFGILLGHGNFVGGIGIATGVSVSPPGKNASTTQKTVHYPFIGAFMHRLTARQQARHGGGRSAVTRDDSTNFYFDDYLALWVDISYTDTSYSVLLYLDQAKTQPAGHLVSTFPLWDSSFPQVYHSDFEVTAGTLNGAHGFYDTTINADYSSQSAYESSFPDGTHSKGRSSWSANGESSWSDRTEGAGGYFYQTNGQFHTDGSGHTVSRDSSGYGQEYTYNADGSGSGLIQGPDAGLPAKIVWDNTGKVTITWADGTVEVWEPTSPPNGGTGVGGGDSTGGGTGNGTGGGTAPPPP